MPVRIRAGHCLFIDQEMDEAQIGPLFLKALNFDLRQHLETIMDVVNDKHVSDLRKKSENVAAKYRGICHKSVHYYPFPITEAIETGFGIGTE